MSEAGRIALITGAGTGIGKRTALLLLEAGYCVVLVGRRVELLEQTVQEAGVSNSRTLVMSTDVSDPQAVSALFAAIKDKFGRLDVLFNNAGVGAPAVSLEDLRYEQCIGYVRDGNVSMHTARLQDDEAATSARRTYHQQWVDFSAYSPTQFRPVYGGQTRDHRSHQINGFGWSPF